MVDFQIVEQQPLEWTDSGSQSAEEPHTLVCPKTDDSGKINYKVMNASAVLSRYFPRCVSCCNGHLIRLVLVPVVAQGNTHFASIVPIFSPFIYIMF